MRLLPLSFTTEGSSHSKRISTDAILALTGLPNSFMDLVASLTHDPLPKRYIDRHVFKGSSSYYQPSCTKFKTTKFNSGGLIELFTKFPPTKITRYSKTSNNGSSVKQTTSVQRTAHLPPIDLTIELIHFEPPRSGHLSTPNNGH